MLNFFKWFLILAISLLASTISIFIMYTLLHIFFGPFGVGFDLHSLLDIDEDLKVVSDTLLYPWNFATTGEQGVEPGVSVPSSSIGANTSSDVSPTSLDQQLSGINSKIISEMNKITNLKDQFIRYASNNKIPLIIGQDGRLGWECYDSQENIMHIKWCNLSSEIEYLINMVVKAEMFKTEHNCEVHSLDSSVSYIKGLIKTFPVINDSDLTEYYDESKACNGDRFVHDLRARPENFDPIRSPSPTLAHSHVDNAGAESGLNTNLGIKRTIEEELPIKTVFKKPK